MCPTFVPVTLCNATDRRTVHDFSNSYLFLDFRWPLSMSMTFQATTRYIKSI